MIIRVYLVKFKQLSPISGPYISLVLLLKNTFRKQSCSSRLSLNCLLDSNILIVGTEGREERSPFTNLERALY